MPSQRLFDRFEIITRISSGILQVFLARERKSGNDALLREFPVDGTTWTDGDLAEKAKAKLADLEPGIDLGHFADAELSEDKRKAWVVTWVVKDVAAEPGLTPPANAQTAPMASERAAAPKPVEPVAPAAPAAVGEFTRMFTPPARHIQTAEPISLVGATVPPPEAVRPPIPPPVKPMDSGEFTRIFGTPAAKPDTTALPVIPALAKEEGALPSNEQKENAPNVFDAFVQRGQAKPQPHAPTVSPFPPVPPSASKPEQPGSFTQAFGSAPNAPIGEPHAAELAPTAEYKTLTPSAPPPQTTPSAPAKQAGPGDFTNIFGAAPRTPIGEPVAAKPKPLSDPFSEALKGAPAKKEEPGAFTQLFNGPKLTAPDAALKGPGHQPTLPVEWRTPAPAETPHLSKSAPGEFTQMFQNSQSPASTPTPSLPPPAPASTPVFPSTKPAEGPGELTQLFTMKTPPNREPVKADPFADFAAPANPSGSPESLTQILSRAPASANTSPAPPAAPPQRNTPAPFSPASPIAPERPSDGATHIFNQPKPAAPVAPPPPSGPGEYTRIISAPRFGQPGEPTPQAAAQPLAAGGPPVGGAMMPQVNGPQISGPQFSGPQFSGPQMSSSQLSGPQMSGPQFSGPYVQAPHVQAPQMNAPSLQPAAPAATPVPASVEKKGIAAYLPLIVILNVLLILAIALVLYFALRHH